MPADAVFRVGRAFGMTTDRSVYQAVAVKVQALREAAARTPAGQWIISSRCWHETHLREGRLPTARELDAASVGHPIFVQRGGHVGVVNSVALQLAGITATSADPPSGTVVRLGDRTPAGGRPVHDPDGLLGPAGSA